MHAHFSDWPSRLKWRFGDLKEFSSTAEFNSAVLLNLSANSAALLNSVKIEKNITEFMVYKINFPNS